jgi:hypothetical protein
MDALYYPRIHPPEDWLRRTLLLVDSVVRFVPSDEDQTATRIGRYVRSFPMSCETRRLRRTT